jgi:hypothetical protein
MSQFRCSYLIIWNQFYTYVIVATDPENDTLRFSLGIRPQGMAIDEKTGIITWTPQATQVGSQYHPHAFLPGGDRATLYLPSQGD